MLQDKSAVAAKVAYKLQLNLLQKDMMVAKAHLSTSHASHHLLSKLVAWWLTIGSLVLLILTHGEEGSSSCRRKVNLSKREPLCNIKCDKGERQVQRSALTLEQTQLTANCLVTELGLVVIIVWRVVVVVNLVICLFVVVTACGMQWIEQHTQSFSPMMRCNC